MAAVCGRSTRSLDLMPKMERAELEKSWATSGKHLRVARKLLPEVPVLGVDGASVGGFEECMRHNEMELALDELEDLGLANAPPPEFWSELASAAANMELTDRATDLRQRSGNA